MFAVGTLTIKGQIQTILKPTTNNRTKINGNPTTNNNPPIKAHLERPIIKQLDKTSRTLQTKGPTKQTGKGDLTTTKHRRDRNQMLMDKHFIQQRNCSENKCLSSLTAAVFVASVCLFLFGQVQSLMLDCFYFK